MRLLIVGILIFGVTYSAGQVTVVQGESEIPPPIPRYHSPMIVEMPFKLANPAYWRDMSTWTTRDLANHICDGVEIQTLLFATSEPRKGVVPFTFTPRMYNEPGVDKRVDLTLEWRRGEQVVHREVISNIKVEEKKYGGKPYKFSIAADTLRAEPAPTLWIKMVVRDDP